MTDGSKRRDTAEHFAGRLLGGAVGDALGAPVEFLDLSAIVDRYGPQGITGFDVAYGRRGAITDDTQTTLFTAGGLPVSLPTEDIIGLGAGWVGEEALAISLYCALRVDGDFTRGVLLAVNHSGDSDSTGAITGNPLGLMLGIDAIPRRWRDELELKSEIEVIARDLHARFDDSDAWPEIRTNQRFA